MDFENNVPGTRIIRTSKTYGEDYQALYRSLSKRGKPTLSSLQSLLDDFGLWAENRAEVGLGPVPRLSVF